MNLENLISQGGVIVYILIFLNIIGFSIIFAKIVSLISFKKNLSLHANKLYENLSNKKQIDIENACELEIKKLEAGLGTIKMIASTAPLLGLLGTVYGILMAFQTMGKVGLDDPSVFSSSIAIALITTVAGLIVAIPHHIFYNYYIGALDNNEIKLKNEILNKL